MEHSCTTRPPKQICIYSPVMMALGGIETHLINLSCHLSAAGWEVNLCVRHSRVAPSTVQRLAVSGVKYHRHTSLGFIRNVLLSSSLLYTNSAGSSSPWIWRFGRTRRGGFHHCHTACSHSETTHWTKSYLRFITQETRPVLVACSQITAQNLRQLNPGRRIVHMPYYAISTTPTLAQELPRGRTGDKRVHLGFVGRLEASKGIHLLVQASEHDELADVCWHIYGGGSQEAAVRAAAGPNFVYHGSFDRDTPLEQIYGGLDAVVLPSQHVEGSPLCLIEALAHGKPWISFDRGGIRDLVADSEYCIISPGEDMEGFVATLKLMRDRLREKKVPHDKLQHHYKAHFSPDAVGAKWDKLCSDMLHQANR